MSYKLRILKVRSWSWGLTAPIIIISSLSRLLRFSAFDVELLFKNDFISDRISVSPKKIFRCNVSFLKINILNKSFRVLPFINWNRFTTLRYNKSKISRRQFSKLSFLHASLDTLQFKQISPIRNMNIQNSTSERKWSEMESHLSLYFQVWFERRLKNIETFFMNTSITLMMGDALWL